MEDKQLVWITIYISFRIGKLTFSGRCSVFPLPLSLPLLIPWGKRMFSSSFRSQILLMNKQVPQCCSSTYRNQTAGSHKRPHCGECTDTLLWGLVRQSSMTKSHRDHLWGNESQWQQHHSVRRRPDGHGKWPWNKYRRIVPKSAFPRNI